MRTTNITAEMVYITPEVAKNYLRYNTKNRNLSLNNRGFLSNQMKKGAWMENGESIIFDINGELKDGQHRLEAIIVSGKSYWFPVIRGVKSSSMSTIDTGKNRTAADVLFLNGYKYSSVIASSIKAIFLYDMRKSKKADIGGLDRRQAPTNAEILEYCNVNYDLLLPMVSRLYAISEQQAKPRVFSVTQLFIFTYLIGGLEPNEHHYEFLKHISGVERINGTAPSYLFGKVNESKAKKEPLNFYWLLGMVLKAWNYYADGNPSIKHFRFNVDEELPKSIKYIG